MSLLRVENLSKEFGGVHAVEDLSFELGGGLVHSIIGPNGAGTTIRTPSPSPSPSRRPSPPTGRA